MKDDATRRAPNLKAEVPEALGDKHAAEVEDLLIEKFGDALEDGERFAVELFVDKSHSAGLFRCALGTPQKPHIFEFFVRDVPGRFPDGAIGRAVAFGVSAFEEFFKEDRDAYFNIDFVGHAVDGDMIFARSQVRNLEAERMADEWLAKHDEGGHEA